MKKMILLFILMLTLNVGCATMYSDRRQTMHLDSNPKGADVRSNKLDHPAKTPTSFSFWKSGDVYVNLSKEGYKEQTIEVNRYLAPLFWGNLLGFQLAPFGMAIDALSGAMWNYENTVFGTLDVAQEGVVPEQSQPYVASLASPFKWPQSGSSGPRLGVTYLNDEAVAAVNKGVIAADRVGNVITEFGWHFEKSFFANPDKKGMAFTVGAIPLIGGVDQNRVLLSLTGLLGIQTENGITFGIGPRLDHNDSDDNTSTSLAYMGGANFKYYNVTIPLTLQVTTSRQGTRISLLTGFSR